MNRQSNFLLAGSLIVGSVVLGVGLLKHAHTDKANTAGRGDSAPATQPPVSSTVKKPLYWFDPMRPQEHFDTPGKSPFMDMQLVAKYPDEATSTAAAPAGSIAIDPRVVQNLGLRLSAVERGNLARSVDTVGVVAVDEHRIEAIEVREPGWVEVLDVRAAGDPVRRGQRLAAVYAPDLLATQQELLIARNSEDAQLVEAARRRLALFGLSATQIAHIEKTGQAERRVDYYAPFDGYVMELGARQGAAVAPGTVLFQLAALDSIWINAEVPEIQAGWIQPGDPATAELPSRPGERFQGRIDYLYPELTQATRSLKVRIVMKNPGIHLRPGMFATVHLRGTTQDQVLTIPTEAVIKTGTRSVVIVADDGSHFRPALVRVGAEHGGRSEILEGLSAGQNVVVSGQFLIDSEASLRGAFENLAGSNELMPAPSAQAPDGAR
ncbi:MAG: efflux RND transporter periplasmic adaptor subunit [Pseudomonadota bacterium]|nr:efflux RND transporter periplasmic adaptor subunit [Pseudomonadota bacterium]